MASKNSTKKQQVQQTKNAVAVSKATSVDIEKSLGSLSTAGIQIQSTLSKISEELIQKHSELQAVDDAIRLKREEMQNLHGVDQVLLTIDEAKSLHQEHLDKMQKQREELQQEYSDLQNQQAQERARQEEEYNYNLQQTRKNETDQWAEALRVRSNAERDRKEAFEKDLAVRTAALVAKETEYQAALQKSATFDADVAKEVAKAEAILKNVLTKDFNHKQEIADITHKTTIEKYQFDQQRMVQTANTLEQNVKELQAQLKAAYEKNAELASKAVDGAANAKATADAISTLSSLNNGNGARPRS